MENWTPKDLETKLESGQKVFLKLWKKGCGACNLSIPATERLEATNEAGLLFGQISTDDYPEMLEISESGVVPAFFVFKDRKLVDQFVGFKGIAKLQALVDQVK